MREIYFNKALNEALREKMSEDESVLLIGEDIGVYGGAFKVTEGLLESFGEKRVIETPISENSFMGVATGLAMMGFKPVVEIMFMDFIALAFDQILNHTTKFHYMYNGQVNIPMVIRTPAGAKGGYGPSHSQSLEALFIGIPGLKVVAPSDPYTAKGLLKSAINDPNPVLFVENKVLYGTKGEVPEESYLIPLNQAMIRREGTDLTIISYSRMLQLSLKVASFLEKQGVTLEVLDLISLSPLDEEAIIASIKKTKRVVVVDEGCKTGGIGAEISALLAEEAIEYLDAPIIRVGLPNVPIPASIFLERHVIPDEQKILDAVDQCLNW
ncbi:MAG: hypothetical protein AMJ91_00445 [candidate division Zixibacteria bacterium SM23_73_3]|nr:MAG: hypothetical protein AMJ91_00445 [candidate division Zixibacteria bacterium SM23_73_3]